MKAIRDELEEWKRCYKDLESETKELFLCYKEKIENLKKGCCWQRHFRNKEVIPHFKCLYVLSQNCPVVWKIIWT